MKKSLAISYAMKKKGKKSAESGMMQGSGHSRSHFDEGGRVKAQASLRSAFGTPAEPTPSPDKDLDQKYKDTAKKESSIFSFAEGGQIKDNYQPSGKPHVDKEFGYEAAEKASGLMKHEGNDVKSNSAAMSEDSKKLGQMPVDMKASTEAADDDLVMRIMRKRYSEGGKVANQEHGENNNELAGFSPNEFDDLVLRDDLESSYDGDNAGDHLGNAQEDEDRKDIVARIMASRKKKDRMPNPA